jgi:hypothetical protein
MLSFSCILMEGERKCQVPILRVKRETQTANRKMQTPIPNYKFEPIPVLPHIFHAVYFVSIISSLELHCAAASAQHNKSSLYLLGEYLPVVEASLALGAAEAMLMPFSAQGLNVLPDDGRFALPALGCPSLCSLGLALDAPGVAVLLDVRHALLEGVAALGTEEMTVVPVLAQGNNMLSHDRGRAVLASRSKQLVPVEVAIKTHALIAILGHG